MNERLFLRRWVCRTMVALLLVVSAACGSAATSQPPQGSGAGSTPKSLSALKSGARTEGAMTWYASSYERTVAEHLAAAFQKTYGVKVNLFRSQTGPVNQRFASEEKSGHHVADVISTSDESAYVQFKREGLVAKYTPLDEKKLLPPYRNLDPDGYYQTGSVGDIVIIYNTNRLSRSEAPHNWKSLLASRWKEQIAAGSPVSSGYAANWATYLYTRYGEGYLKSLSKQNVLVSQSIIDVENAVASGNRLVGAVSGGTARESLAADDPIGVVYPSDGTPVLLPPMAISRQAPHANAARLFEYFIYTKKAQKIYAKAGYLPLTKESPDPPGGTPPDPSQLKHVTLQELKKSVNAVRDAWQRYFGA